MEFLLGKTLEEIINNQAILNQKIDKILERLPKQKGEAKND